MVVVKDTHKKSSYGGCQFERMMPPWDDVNTDTPIINIVISFEEALKLKLAIETCLIELNKYKRSAKEGMRAAINMAIAPKDTIIAIDEGKLKS